LHCERVTKTGSNGNNWFISLHTPMLRYVLALLSDLNRVSSVRQRDTCKLMQGLCISGVIMVRRSRYLLSTRATSFLFLHACTCKYMYAQICDNSAVRHLASLPASSEDVIPCYYPFEGQKLDEPKQLSTTLKPALEYSSRMDDAAEMACLLAVQLPDTSTPVSRSVLPRLSTRSPTAIRRRGD